MTALLNAVADGSPTCRSTTVARLLAPIVNFTTDEAWSYFKSGQEYCEDSIHLENWPTAPDTWKWPKNIEEFENVLKFRNRVNELLEKARQAKEIGKSLDAVVTIYGRTDDPLFSTLQKFEPKLAEIFITSQVSMELKETDDVSVSVQPASGDRCPRCWRTVKQLVANKLEEDLCPRCVDALKL